MKRQRPVRVLAYYSLPGGGIGKYSHHLLSELARDPALELELLAQPDFVWREQATYAVRPELFQISDRRPLLRKARFLAGQLINPRRLVAHAREWLPQVVHLADVNHLFLPVWEQGLFCGDWRVVMTVHDVKRLAAILEQHWEDRQLQRAYRLCDALFVHSQAQGQELVEYADVDPARVQVIPHGPNPYAAYRGDLTKAALRARWGVPERALVVLFFGFIKPYKGLDVLLEALALLDDETPIHLLVAGSGGGRYADHLQACEGLMARPGIERKVTAVLRHIEDAEVPELFTLCDAVALPYRPVFTSQSGVLNVASYYRRPILATPAPAFVEGQETGPIGVIAEDFSAAAYAEALRAWARYSEADWAFERYLEANSWERAAERTRAVYQSLAAGETGCASRFAGR